MFSVLQLMFLKLHVNQIIVNGGMGPESDGGIYMKWILCLCIKLYISCQHGTSMRLSIFSSGFCDEVCLMIGEGIYAQMLNRADAIKMDNIMYLYNQSVYTMVIVETSLP